MVLRYCRYVFGMTATKLAERLKIHRSMITRWEKNQKKISDKRKAELAEIFGIKAECFDKELTDELRKMIDESHEKMIKSLIEK